MTHSAGKIYIFLAIIDTAYPQSSNRAQGYQHFPDEISPTIRIFKKVPQKERSLLLIIGKGRVVMMVTLPKNLMIIFTIEAGPRFSPQVSQIDVTKVRSAQKVAP